MELKGRVAIVTGGSRGIGRAICTKLAELGADVVINYAGNAAAAEQTKSMCEKYGVRAIVVQGDVSKAEDCKALVEAACETLGKVDILVNNAGITRDGLLMRMSDEDFDSVVDTNLGGTFNCMRAVMRPMMRQKFGRIISISSIVGVIGSPGQVNYAASKAGIIGMTKALARECASKNITVNAVAPGFIETDMTDVLSEELRSAMLAQIPLKSFGTVQDVANAVAFLASDEAGYITGQVLQVNGGMAM